MTVASIPREEWQEHAQSFELKHWSDCLRNRAPTDEIRRETSCRIWQRLEFTQDAFAGKTVLDIGPGPTGRCLWLEGRFLAIEPLADEYLKLPGVTLDEYERVYNQPAEERIPELVGAMDAVVSLNCLDHCYDLPTILRNVMDYLKPGGTAFLSFDVDDPVDHDPTHPIRLSGEQARATIEASGLLIDKFDFGGCPFGVPWRKNWGGGTAFHWWCRSPLDRRDQ